MAKKLRFKKKLSNLLIEIYSEIAKEKTER